MRFHYTQSVFVIGAVVILVLFGSTLAPVMGQPAASYRAPRTSDGQPDLNGIWQALNTANWDLEDHPAQPAPFVRLLGTYLAQPPGLSVVDGGAIPYKPEALAKRDENVKTRLAPDPYSPDTRADSEAKCFAAPPPRAAYVPYPFQIVQKKNLVIMAYEFAGTPRMIYLGMPVDAQLFYAFDNWLGQSTGRWEGDTLVVETQGFRVPHWLDRAGNFMSEKAKVTERYTRSSPYHLQYEATIEDPDTFTHPWTLRMPLYRRMESNMRLLEFQCIPFTEEFIYGSLAKKPGK
jgi:hypothetical protein